MCPATVPGFSFWRAAAVMSEFPNSQLQKCHRYVRERTNISLLAQSPPSNAAILFWAGATLRFRSENQQFS
jgi:hypothetical protein